MTLTSSERRALQLVLLIAVSGLVGKVWIRTHPPSQALPTATDRGGIR